LGILLNLDAVLQIKKIWSAEYPISPKKEYHKHEESKVVLKVLSLSHTHTLTHFLYA